MEEGERDGGVPLCFVIAGDDVGVPLCFLIAGDTLDADAAAACAGDFVFGLVGEAVATESALEGAVSGESLMVFDVSVRVSVAVRCGVVAFGVGERRAARAGEARGSDGDNVLATPPRGGAGERTLDGFSW